MTEKLAIHGGPKAKPTPNIPMFPGGLEIGEEEKAQVLEVLEGKRLFRYYGPFDAPSKVAELEARVRQKVGSEYALATSSCTGSLVCALTAAGIGPGDEVIIPGYTFFATCAVVVNVGAVPVIADCDATLTLDLADVERRITPLTRAIMPVHMRGAPCDMDGLREMCKERNLVLIEDVAQATGGSYKGRYLGTLGDAGCYGFQYHKIITAGEGGMMVTNDRRLYERASMMHDTAAGWRDAFWGPERYEGELFSGTNFRMCELVGGVMLAQLEKLDGLIARMRANQKRIYDGIRHLPGVEVRGSHDAEGDAGICVVYYVADEKVARLTSDALVAEGVGAKTIFDKGIPDWHIYHHWGQIMNKRSASRFGSPWQHPAYVDRGGRVEYSPDQCPTLLNYLGRALHLDVPPQMTLEDCDMIVKGIAKVAHAVDRGELS